MRYLRNATDGSNARKSVITACCILLAITGAARAGTSVASMEDSVVTPAPAPYAPASPAADTTSIDLEPVPEPEPSYNLNPIPVTSRYRVGRHAFTSGTTGDAFDPVIYGSMEGLSVQKGFGIGFELGYIHAEGRPPSVDHGWKLTNSWVKMHAVLMELNIYYNLLDDKGSQPFMPYVGLGPVMWVGSERLRAEATRAPVGIVESFNAEQLALGISFGVAAIAGTTVRIKSDIKLLVESRYVLNSSGSMADLVNEEDEEKLDATLYDAVGRAGFNFSGWQILIGLQISSSRADD